MTFALIATLLGEVFDDSKFSTPLVVNFDLWWRKVQFPWIDVLCAIDNVSAAFLFAGFAMSAIL